MSYTNTFGAETIFPSQYSYQAIALSANTTFAWPTDANAGTNIIAVYNDVTAASPSLAITFPSAALASKGTSIMLNNVGAQTFNVKDNSGVSLQTVAAGEAWVFYLSSNSTAAGTWRSFQFGAGSSTTSATALAGAGLTTVVGQLAEAFPTTQINANYTTSEADRAEIFLWTGGAGTFTFPAASSLTNSWFVGVKNGGSGALTLTPDGSETIDGGNNLALNPNDGCYIFTDGTNLFTLGRGQNATFAFAYLSINVAGSGNYTLSTLQQNQIAYKFTGLLTGNRNIIVPNTVQQYWVTNSTTGAYTFTVKTAAGTGISLASGQSAILYCDGTNVVNGSTAGIATPIAVNIGGTGTPIQFTEGSIVFAGASGIYSQSNNNLFWDDTNKRLGINNATPAYPLDISSGSASATYAIRVRASTHATSRRAAVAVGDWSILQDTAESGTKNFGIYNSDTAVWALYAGTNGYVGLGESSPLVQLHISTGDQSTNRVRLENTGVGGTTIDLVGGLPGVNNGGFSIYDASSAVTRMHMSGTGNFSFGTAILADYRLYVKSAGTTSATYNLYADNSAGTNLLFLRDDGMLNTGSASSSPYNLTTGSSANVYVAADGTLYRSTSSLRYKTEVQNATHGLSDVLKLRSVTYKQKNKNDETLDSERVFGGLIAEELHAAGLAEFVAYNKDGEPDSIHYGNMAGLFVKAFQELNEKVSILREEIERLKAAAL